VIGFEIDEFFVAAKGIEKNSKFKIQNSKFKIQNAKNQKSKTQNIVTP
jgi:hypothetical protein